MERETFRLPKGLLERVERQVERGEYGSKSDAFRAYIRVGVAKDEAAEGSATKPLDPDKSPALKQYKS